MAIALRIPGIPIKAIGNAKDAWMTLEKHLVESPAIIQCLDFLGVAMRDGGYDIGVHDATFHPVYIAPELEARRVEDLRTIQPGLIQD